MLYEVGDYLNRTGRHRHTHYIISNSEILGYTPQQRRIIAAIARYLGKSRPTMEDGPMKLVDPADRADVQKAILLLRLARALNLGRSRAVQKVHIALRSAGVKVTLLPRRRMGVDLELWAIEKECDYFREVFGRELSTAVS
jgi:exopolyphosphatase/guanosine-5'-triphosphate,3'-diphosphate pyrophosphatase